MCGLVFPTVLLLKQGRETLTWKIWFFWTSSKVRHLERYSVAPENASNPESRAGSCWLQPHLYQGLPFLAALRAAQCSTGAGSDGTDEEQEAWSPSFLQCWLQLGMVQKWALLVTLLRLLWEMLLWLCWIGVRAACVGSCSATPHSRSCSASATAHQVLPNLVLSQWCRLA